MKLAILGATSQIATDLVHNFLKFNPEIDLFLFSRSPKRMMARLEDQSHVVRLKNLDYCKFCDTERFDAVINFVGAGSPNRVKELDNKIFGITDRFDELSLKYLEKQPHCRYIFLSSGAVYGENFESPVNAESRAIFNINNLSTGDWYSLAKLNAEAKHRSFNDRAIVDLRVFSYFSRRQNLTSGFLVSDIVHAILENQVFRTSCTNIYRDYISPKDFHRLIRSILVSPRINMPIDCRSKSPIDKFSILEMCKSKFGLEYVIEQNANDSIGVSKKHYYSVQRSSSSFQFLPELTSLETLESEIDFLLANGAFY